MARVLIISDYADNDAKFVSFAIKTLGHKVTLWDTSQLCHSQDLSVFVNNDSTSSSLEVINDTIDFGENSDVSSVWLRRPHSPMLPNSLHPDDVSFANSENRLFLESILRSALPKALWLNRWQFARAADSKLGQLLLARTLGFRIPESCFSNSASVVAKFMKAIQPRSTLYKPFKFHSWASSKGAHRAIYAQILADEAPPTEFSIRAAPGIFQEYISKQMDIRCICFGGICFAIQIESNHLVDWREASAKGLAIKKPFEMPARETEMCTEMLQAMGVSIGAFDFVLNEDNQLTFLEVNETGQFLWMEEACPQLNIIDAFCRFLIFGPRDFEYHTHSPLRLATIKRDSMLSTNSQ